MSGKLIHLGYQFKSKLLLFIYYQINGILLQFHQSSNTFMILLLFRCFDFIYSLVTMWPGSIFIDSADQYNSAGAPIISFAIFVSGIIATSVVKDNLHDHFVIFIYSTQFHISYQVHFDKQCLMKMAFSFPHPVVTNTYDLVIKFRLQHQIID